MKEYEECTVLRCDECANEPACTGGSEGLTFEPHQSEFEDDGDEIPSECIYLEGMAARQNGSPQSANPYEHFELNSIRWGLGWQTADDVLTEKIRIPDPDWEDAVEVFFDRQRRANEN